MPLDIMPAPAALPAAAPSGLADAPPGGVPLTGSAALLFGLLLAQTVGQAAPKAPPAPVSGAAPAAKGLNTVAETPPALAVTGKGEDKKKDKTPAEALSVLVPIGPLPALPIQAASPPKPSGTQGTGTTKTTQTVNSGKVMDTVPAPGGELLSPQQNSAPSEVDLIPTETGLSILPRAPVPTETPLQAVTANPSGATASALQALPVAGPTPAPPPVPPSGAPPPSVAVAAALATPPASKNVPARTPLSMPLTAGLKNNATTADNQPVKNAGSKIGSLPAPAAGDTAKVAVKASPAVTGEQPSKARPVPGAGQEGHTAETPTPSAQAAPAAAPGQMAAPMPPADRTRMLAQVTHSLETMTPKVGVTAGRQQVTLQLHPQDWGHLNVRVTMTPTTGADGKVSTQVIAHVIAEHPAVKAALETGQTELRHALREAGLHLDRLTVTVQAPAAGSETSAGSSRQESRSGEGWGGGQAAPFGTTAQGGSNPGGQHPAPSAAFAQGRMAHTTTHTAGMVPEDTTIPITTAATGRVDTRA